MIMHFRELRVYRQSKLTDADSEAAETQSWLEFALRCGYITQEIFDELDAVYDKVSGGLVNMMANAEQWCISTSQVREDGGEYEVTESLTYPHTHVPTNMEENDHPPQMLDKTTIRPTTGIKFLTEPDIKKENKNALPGNK